jgi:hypothetical protein
MVKQLDVGAESGTYKIDAFVKRFEIEKLRDLRTVVNRLVRLAAFRADWDENPARHHATEFMDNLTTAEQALSPLLRGDPAVIAADLMPAFRGGSPASALVQVIESARSLSEWAKHLRSFQRTPAAASASAPLPHHLTALAAKLYEDRLGKLPPKTRGHWLAEFLFAVRQDFQLPIREGRGDDAIGYWGRKLQEFLSNPNSRPESKLTP